MKFRVPRPLWFGLAAVALVIILVVLVFGVPMYQQRGAIASIERLGGRFTTTPIGSERIRKWVGEQRIASFESVTGVYCGGSRLTDTDLSVVCNLPDVTVVDLQNTQVTDAGIAYLRQLRELRALVLSETAVTDVGISSLKVLKELKYLELSSTAVTDDGLKSLHGLGNLRTLFLKDTQVTDAGVFELRTALPDVYVAR